MTAINVSAFVTPGTVEVVGMLGKALGSDWTLVGGMMVGVHLAGSDRQPLRLTKDADLVIDVRAVVDPPLLERAASALMERGFEPQPQANERGETVCHRFVADDVKVDLLAPEGLRADSRSLTTVSGGPERSKRPVARKPFSARPSSTSKLVACPLGPHTEPARRAGGQSVRRSGERPCRGPRTRRRRLAHARGRPFGDAR